MSCSTIYHFGDPKKIKTTNLTVKDMYWREENPLSAPEYLEKEYQDALSEFRLAEAEFLRVKAEFNKKSSILQQKNDDTTKMLNSITTEKSPTVEEIELKDKITEIENKIRIYQTKKDLLAKRRAATNINFLLSERANLKAAIRRHQSEIDQYENNTKNAKEKMAEITVNDKTHQANDLDRQFLKISQKNKYLKSLVKNIKNSFDVTPNVSAGYSSYAKRLRNDYQQILDQQISICKLEEQIQRRPIKHQDQINSMFDQIEELNERMIEIGLSDDTVDVTSLRKKYEQNKYIIKPYTKPTKNENKQTVKIKSASTNKSTKETAPKVIKASFAPSELRKMIEHNLIDLDNIPEEPKKKPTKTYLKKSKPKHKTTSKRKTESDQNEERQDQLISTIDDSELSDFDLEIIDKYKIHRKNIDQKKKSNSPDPLINISNNTVNALMEPSEEEKKPTKTKSVSSAKKKKSAIEINDEEPKPTTETTEKDESEKNMKEKSSPEPENTVIQVNNESKNNSLDTNEVDFEKIDSSSDMDYESINTEAGTHPPSGNTTQNTINTTIPNVLNTISVEKRDDDNDKKDDENNDTNISENQNLDKESIDKEIKPENDDFIDDDTDKDHEVIEKQNSDKTSNDYNQQQITTKNDEDKSNPIEMIKNIVSLGANKPKEDEPDVKSKDCNISQIDSNENEEKLGMNEDQNQLNNSETLENENNDDFIQDEADQTDEKETGNLINKSNDNSASEGNPVESADENQNLSNNENDDFIKDETNQIESKENGDNNEEKNDIKTFSSENDEPEKKNDEDKSNPIEMIRNIVSLGASKPLEDEPDVKSKDSNISQNDSNANEEKRTRVESDNENDDFIKDEINQIEPKDSVDNNEVKEEIENSFSENDEPEKRNDEDTHESNKDDKDAPKNNDEDFLKSNSDEKESEERNAEDFIEDQVSNNDQNQDQIVTKDNENKNNPIELIKSIIRNETSSHSDEREPDNQDKNDEISSVDSNNCSTQNEEHLDNANAVNKEIAPPILQAILGDLTSNIENHSEETAEHHSDSEQTNEDKKSSPHNTSDIKEIDINENNNSENESQDNHNDLENTKVESNQQENENAKVEAQQLNTEPEENPSHDKQALPSTIIDKVFDVITQNNEATIPKTEEEKVNQSNEPESESDSFISDSANTKDAKLSDENQGDSDSVQRNNKEIEEQSINEPKNSQEDDAGSTIDNAPSEESKSRNIDQPKSNNRNCEEEDEAKINSQSDKEEPLVSDHHESSNEVDNNDKRPNVDANEQSTLNSLFGNIVNNLVDNSQPPVEGNNPNETDDKQLKSKDDELNQKIENDNEASDQETQKHSDSFVEDFNKPDEAPEEKENSEKIEDFNNEELNESVQKDDLSKNIENDAANSNQNGFGTHPPSNENDESTNQVTSIFSSINQILPT